MDMTNVEINALIVTEKCFLKTISELQTESVELCSIGA
jgi:hypothetical protein